MTRRDAIRAGLGGMAGLGGAAMLGVGGASATAPKVMLPRKRVLRVAHLTDLHIQPERRAYEGVAACLRHVQGGPDKPDLILTGGDLIMDGFAATRDRTKDAVGPVQQSSQG